MLQHRTGPGPPETSTCGHGLVLEVGQLDHSTDGRGAGAQDFKMLRELGSRLFGTITPV